MTGLHIAEEQLAERDAWERRLIVGECTLQTALLMVLETGAPPTHRLIERLHHAFDSYSTGQLLYPGEKRPKTLADAFGAIRWDIQKVEAERFAHSVFELVMELHGKHPKGHPDHLALTRQTSRTRKAGHTAFSRAAELYQISESSVIKYYGIAKSLPDRAKGSE